MINCKLINNSHYTQTQREELLDSVFIDDNIPHVFLNTCNRMELYWGDGYVSDDVLRHLYRVASGLESNIVGERAIQGQLKLAYAEACKKYKLSSKLNRLFQSAMHTGKRVRTETKISEGAVSHSQVTVNILKNKDIDLTEKVVCIIGINKLTEDILKFLTANQGFNIFLSNRSFDKAQELANKYNGTAVNLDDRNMILKSTDVLICATSAHHVIVEKQDIPSDREMIIFDLAFPRDVAQEVDENPNIQLYDLEHIEQFAKNNLQLRHDEIVRAEQIIEEEISKFNTWQSFTNKIIL